MKHPDIAEKILEMAKKDQELRCDPRAVAFEPEAVEKFQAMDKENTKKLRAIVEDIGWPTVSKVGKESSHAAWLLVQHADHDLEFQRHCLELMEQESEDEVSEHNIIYLTDRVRMHEGRPQLYGTQFIKLDDSTDWRPYEVESMDKANKARKRLGIPTVEKRTRELNNDELQGESSLL